MTEEQIKNWAREKANALEENQTLGIYDRDEDMRYDEGYNDGQVSGYEEGLIEGYNEGFKDCAKSRLNVTTISDCPIKDDWHKQEIEDIYDLIAEDWSIKYFICIMKDKSRVTAIGNCDEGCNGEVSVNLFFDHDDEKYYIDDIVWWKEIVLPKEIE